MNDWNCCCNCLLSRRKLSIFFQWFVWNRKFIIHTYTKLRLNCIENTVHIMESGINLTAIDFYLMFDIFFDTSNNKQISNCSCIQMMMTYIFFAFKAFWMRWNKCQMCNKYWDVQFIHMNPNKLAASFVYNLSGYLCVSVCLFHANNC